MERGKWYLITQDFDSMENRCPEFESKVEINTEGGLASEEAALAKAKEIWENRHSHLGWEKVVYPRRPRLVYEVILEENKSK